MLLDTPPPSPQPHLPWKISTDNRSVSLPLAYAYAKHFEKIVIYQIEIVGAH